jgi:hypothetical protein
MRERAAGLLLVFAIQSSMGLHPASAQDHHAAADHKPAALLSGLGKVHHPIATRSPEAQRYFDQGLALVYAFNHEEAIRSFRRSAEIDPGAAMPLWGIAYALGPNINMSVDADREKAASEAASKALALASGAPENERAYIEAVARRYSDDPEADLHALALDFAEAMGDLSRRYPDDLDAATLYAESMMNLRPWKLWTPDGRPAKGTQEIVAVLESVLRRDPEHLGANHYYIHAVEASPNPERAMASAKRLETLAPGAGHLVHMPAHIYNRAGDYAAASASNAAAAAADRAYFRLRGSEGMYPVMYYGHNLHFLAVTRGMEGKYAQAQRAAADLVAFLAPKVPTGPLPPEMVAFLEIFMQIPATMAARFHRWDEVLRAPAPEARYPIATALHHAARGDAFAAKGDTAKAEEERRAFAAIAVVPPEAGYGLNLGADVLEAAGAILDARIAEARGQTEAAIEAWRRATEADEGQAYSEPPDWFIPPRESLGGALLRAGRPAEAEEVFRAGLERTPRSGRLLFGLMESLKAQGKTADAGWVRRQFEAAWKGADVKLSVADL